MAYTLAQIAHIETDFSEKFGIPRQSGLVEELRARIVFEPEFRSPDAVRGLDGYDYIWLVWQFSTVVQAGQDGTNWRPTVRPPRLGGNTRMGVFATRSPFRPNALGLSSVKLLKVEPNTPQGPVLTVGGADLLDGTPIFDIKPYLPYVDAHPDARGGFTDTTKFYTLQVQAEPEVLEQIRRGIDQFVIDGVLDSGIIEQLTEEDWVSPFPQFQTTQRPDRAALAVLEGRIVLLCDNSPVALILPTDLNSFLKTSDDYYNRFGVATFARILRYMAAFFAMTLPGLYLAVTNFHTQILPTPLLLSFWEARIGVPFPAALEVILMEISFELLREAGVRLPGAMGNTIGIVGGLIIGQAAVDANLVSPIVVIVVAFTALCSFSIPNEEFAFSFRILKFYVIVLSAWLGFFGFLIALLTVFIHLSRLESFGIPYLMPFVGADVNDYHDERDSIWRAPLKKMVRRPIYAKRGERIRLRKK